MVVQISFLQSKTKRNCCTYN